MDPLNLSKKICFGILATAIAAIVISFSLNLHQELFRKILEVAINHTTQNFFSGTVRLRKSELNPKLQILIQGFQANLQSKNRPIPIEIREISTQSPFTNIFKPGGLVFYFQGAHLQSSKRIGVSGSFKIHGIRKWQVDLKTNAIDIDLDEFIWLNPENLEGSTGHLDGNLTFETNSLGETDLTSDLKVALPGGNLQGKFFGLIAPYLPSPAAKMITEQLASSGGLVRYQNAELNLNLIRSNQLKVVLKILIPDYNLDLNLNLLIRLDKDHSFAELAYLMGFVKIKTK